MKSVHQTNLQHLVFATVDSGITHGLVTLKVDPVNVLANQNVNVTWENVLREILAFATVAQPQTLRMRIQTRKEFIVHTDGLIANLQIQRTHVHLECVPVLH